MQHSNETPWRDPETEAEALALVREQAAWYERWRRCMGLVEDGNEEDDKEGGFW